MLRLFLGLVGLTMVWGAGGCSTTRTTDTARTGIEQILISNAVDQTLDRISLPPVQGRKVFMDTQFLDAVDKGYIIGSLRQRLLTEGALLCDKKEESELTLEVCSGGVGTDATKRFMGVPGMAVPGPFPIQIPEVRLYERGLQFGTAKLSVVAYTTATGQLIYDSGRVVARSDDSHWSVLGVGPFYSGTARDELSLARSRRPMSQREANRSESNEDLR